MPVRLNVLSDKTAKHLLEVLNKEIDYMKNYLLPELQEDENYKEFKERCVDKLESLEYIESMIKSQLKD